MRSSPALSEVGEAILDMARSAALFETVVVAVSELLPVTLSLGEETVAVFVIVPVVLGAFTTRSKLADAPAARDARVHVTVDVPEQLQPVPLAETNVVPLGIDKLVVKLRVAKIVQVLGLFVHVPPKFLHEPIARTTGLGGGLAAIAAGTAARRRTHSPAPTMSGPRACLRDGPHVACLMTLPS